MAEIKILFRNYEFLRPVVRINHKEIRLKKENGIYVGKMQTENDKILLEVFTFHEFQSKYWFIVAYFFFIISVLGIFDIRHEKRFRALKYEGEVMLSGQSEISIECNSFEPNTKALALQGNCEIETHENIYYIDESLKKKKKLLRWAKLATWVLAIGIVVFIVIKLFIIGG